MTMSALIAAGAALTILLTVAQPALAQPPTCRVRRGRR
jgi:hypothetical protein